MTKIMIILELEYVLLLIISTVIVRVFFSPMFFISFCRYLLLVRKLQLTYRMEPAGSHGVWSLDDYQFVPFIWGSSQLVGLYLCVCCCYSKVVSFTKVKQMSTKLMH
jgi:hypothetical protein